MGHVSSQSHTSVAVSTVSGIIYQTQIAQQGNRCVIDGSLGAEGDFKNAHISLRALLFISQFCFQFYMHTPADLCNNL